MGLEAARRCCPYLRDRAQRHLSVDELLPPGKEDMWAHQATSAAGWDQGKHELRKLTEHVSLLPKGLPPQVHSLCASAYPSPFTEPQGISDDLDYAIRNTLALGASASVWRRK